MAINLLELVSKSLTPDTLKGMSGFLGESNSAVQSGMGVLLPALLGGLASKAATPSGASSTREPSAAHIVSVGPSKMRNRRASRRSCGATLVSLYPRPPSSWIRRSAAPNSSSGPATLLAR